MKQFESFASRNDPNFFVPISSENKSIPVGLKNQVILIIKDTCNSFNSFSNEYYGIPYSEILCQKIVDLMLKVIKELKLTGYNNFSYQSELTDFLKECYDFHFFMSATEYFCVHLSEILNSHPVDFEPVVDESKYKNYINKVIFEINFRFKENGIGYEYNLDSQQFIPVDSELINQNAIKPAIESLTEPRFTTALEELKGAYKNLQNNDPGSAIVCANNSFESTMKVIYQKRGWEYKNKATKRLIKVAFDNGLIPKSTEAFAHSLRSVLENGVPTIRNNFGGHGQGPESKETPNHLGRFVLNMTASLIHFLIEADRNFNKKT